jgi:hypothetical protein
MLLLNLSLLIDVTFSTPTGCFANYAQQQGAVGMPLKEADGVRRKLCATKILLLNS